MGVGKTTTAVNLSAGLAKAGKRVGLVDLDPQAHATLHVGGDPRSPRNTTYHLLTGDAEFAGMWRTVDDGLKVAAAHLDLAAAEIELGRRRWARSDSPRQARESGRPTSTT